MENQIYQDTALLLYAVGLGLFIGLFYEVFRFLRIALPHHGILVALEDALFFLCVIVAILFFQFIFSDGVVRWFSLFGITAGFLLYLNTVGRILKRFSTLIIHTIKRILKFIYRLTLFPLIKVFKKITVCLFTQIKKLAIMEKEKRRKRSLKRRKQRFLRFAATGFSK